MPSEANSRFGRFAPWDLRALSWAASNFARTSRKPMRYRWTPSPFIRRFWACSQAISTPLALKFKAPGRGSTSKATAPIAHGLRNSCNRPPAETSPSKANRTFRAAQNNSPSSCAKIAGWKRFTAIFRPISACRKNASKSCRAQMQRSDWITIPSTFASEKPRRNPTHFRHVSNRAYRGFRTAAA